MVEENTNWCQSVTGVVIREGKVLLARHTYGPGKGLLIIPGGYLKFGESPEEALKREYLEETHILVEPRQVIGIRFSKKDWYVAYAADYVSGEAATDHDENDEVVWMEISEALIREDVPDLTKKLILCAQKANKGFEIIPYESRAKNGPSTLYGPSIEA